MSREIVQKVMDVFLASPNDLIEERETIKKVISLANEIVRDQGWHIELYGWEDTLPGFCRPQDLINEDVDRCSLFIGMLWKRWGQSTGQFSSGFEEEFERVRMRNSEIGLPEIWIFFKKIDPALLTDPGEQLKAVMSFKEKLERKKENLFIEFEDNINLHNIVLKFLLKFINKCDLKTPELEGSLQHSPKKAEIDMQNAECIGNPSQLIELMKIATEAIRSGKTCLSLSDTHDDQFNTIRFYLLASALVFQRYTNALLGTHEINLLYLYKEKLDTTPLEDQLILRTIIGSPVDTIPGWYWFKDWEIDRIGSLLYYYVIFDRDANVRMNALSLLNDARIRPKKEWLIDLGNPIKLLIETEDTNLKSLIYSYISEIGIPDDLALLDKVLMTEDRSTHQKILFAKLSIIARKDVNEALDLILSLSSDLISDSITSILKKDASKLQSSVLEKALNHHNASIKLFAIDELEARGELTQEVALSMLVCSNKEIKEKLYRFLINRGWKSDIIQIEKDLQGSGSYYALNGILFSIYSQYSDDELQNDLDWLDLNSPIKYRVLCMRNYEIMKTEIIADLDNEFQGYYYKKEDNIKQKYGDLCLEWFKQNTSECLNNFIRNCYVISALSVISKHDSPENVEIARKYLNNDNIDIKKLALQIIDRQGDISDIPKLMNICKDSYGEIKELAANSAIKLSPGISGASSLFLLTNDKYLTKLAFKSFEDEPIERTKNIAENLIRNSNEFIRSQAVLFLINTLSKDELEYLMENYPKIEYYYNVMCWLDRLLYAPSSIKEAFREKLENV